MAEAETLTETERNDLLGECELVMSFTAYNSIEKMSEGISIRENTRSASRPSGEKCIARSTKYTKAPVVMLIGRVQRRKNCMICFIF